MTILFFFLQDNGEATESNWKKRETYHKFNCNQFERKKE